MPVVGAQPVLGVIVMPRDWASWGPEPRPRTESFALLLARQVATTKRGRGGSTAAGDRTALRFSQPPRELGHLALLESAPWLFQGLVVRQDVVSPGQQRHQLKCASIQPASFQPCERHLKPFTSSPLQVFMGILPVASGPPAMTCHLPTLHAEKLPRLNGSSGSWAQAGARAPSLFPRPLRGLYVHICSKSIW